LRAGGGEQQDGRMRKRKRNVTKMKREIKAFGVFLLSCREGLGLATEDNGKEDMFKVVEIPRQFLQKLHIKGFKLKIANASLRRLFSGAVAGAVSRTTVAPLETIRTHLMVGNGHHSVVGVFHNVMKTEGWQGLFRGNGVNVIRVAPSKAIELFAYDTVKTLLAPKPGEPSHLIIPASTVAGATAGVCSTLCTYPLELLKTRLTIQVTFIQNQGGLL
jgi:solute carrier family 25 phosphate transporter 23/24/25/41